MNSNESFDDIFARLERSAFRSKFKLRDADKRYVTNKGMDVIARHAEDFVAKRLGVKPANDGKQTPMRGHPVFVAQHACACCCRGCLNKWYGIPLSRDLTAEEEKFVVSLLTEWIKRQTEV